jgi:ethanolamine utilization cobalamin adenosyltransferase
MKIEKLEEPVDIKSSITKVVEKIFLICKNDPSFKLKAELESIESEIHTLNKRIAKQDNLLKQSKEIRKDFISRMQSIEESNSNTRTVLLERLGSET